MRTTIVVKAAFVAAALLLSPCLIFAQQLEQDEVPRCAPGNEVVIDFESDLDGTPLVAGELITNQFAPLGVSISAVADGVPAVTAPIIFDSSCPGGCTGEDPDLGTPNSAYGGPGTDMGTGTGATNTTARGKILIIPEDLVDTSPADGLVDDPDDNATGGVITFSFSSPVEISSLNFIDIEPKSATGEGVKVDSNAFTEILVPPLGDNSFQTLILPEHGTNVTTLQIEFVSASGALGELRFCRQICVPDECGVCNGNGTDECGFCPGEEGYGEGRDECDLCPDNELYETAQDECGICFGDGLTCADCADQPNGSFTVDDCGQCVPPEEANFAKDECGVCFGDGSSCSQCGDTDISSTQFLLDSLAFAQFSANKDLIRNFRARTGKRKAFTKALNRSEQLYTENWTSVFSISSSLLTGCESSSCVTTASTADMSTEYAQNSAQLSKIGRRVYRKARQRDVAKRRAKRLNRDRRQLARQDQALLQQIPLETFSCSFE